MYVRLNLTPLSSSLSPLSPPIHAEGHMTSSKRMGHPTDDLQKLKGSLSTLRLQDTDAYTELCEKMRDESDDPTLSVSSIISPPSR